MQDIEDVFTISSGKSLEEAAVMDFILRNGSDVISELSEETGESINREAAPIKLRVGNEKWGLRHIQMRHGEEVKEAGFKNVQTFVSYILDNASRFFEAGAKDRIILVEDLSEKSKGTALIELERRDNFYEVITAHRIRERSLKHKIPLESSRTRDNLTTPARQPLEPGTSPRENKPGMEAGECYGTSETEENIPPNKNNSNYLGSDLVISKIKAGARIEKRDLEQLREVIVENCPNENHPLRKSARSIMLRFHDKPDNYPIDKRAGTRMAEILKQSIEPNSHKRRSDCSMSR